MTLERYHPTPNTYADAVQRVRERLLQLNEPGLAGIQNKYDQLTRDSDEDERLIKDVSMLLNPSDVHDAYLHPPREIRRVTGLGMTAGLLIEAAAYDNYTLTLSGMRPGLLPLPDGYQRSYKKRRGFVSTIRDEANHALDRAGADVHEWLETLEPATSRDLDIQRHIRYGAGVVMACNYRLHEQLIVPDEIDWDSALERLNGSI